MPALRCLFTKNSRLPAKWVFRSLPEILRLPVAGKGYFRPSGGPDGARSPGDSPSIRLDIGSRLLLSHDLIELLSYLDTISPSDDGRNAVCVIDQSTAPLRGN